MNIYEYLIILKNEDKTESIEEFKYQGDLVSVKFNNSKKEYLYSKKNFEYYNKPMKVDIVELSQIPLNEDICMVKKILRFDSYYKIIFIDGTYKTIVVPSLKINKKATQLSGDKINYIKEISRITSVITENGINSKINSIYYENISVNEKSLYRRKK